jgi:hypothetical protein
LVAFIGDSLPNVSVFDNPPMFSLGFTNCRKPPFMGICFPDRIATLHPEWEVRVVAVNGTKLIDWGPRADLESDEDLFSTIPAGDVAVVLLGANDTINVFRPGGPVRQAEFELRAKHLTWALLDRGYERVVWLTTPVAQKWVGTPGVEVLLREYAEAIKVVCTEMRRCRWVDLQARLGPGEVTNPSNVHFTTSGHARITAILEPILARIVARTRSYTPHRWSR